MKQHCFLKKMEIIIFAKPILFLYSNINDAVINSKKYLLLAQSLYILSSDPIPKLICFYFGHMWSLKWTEGS
jgi:hypothetical protein